MNALVKKEIRLLLPAWGMALLVAVVAPWVVWFHGGPELALFFGGAVILAVVSFGREFNLGTGSFLLVQPVNRWRFWWAKVSVLAVAFALMLAAFCFSFQLWANATFANLIRQNQLTSDAITSFKQQVWKEHYLGGLFAVMAFSGGLWAVLLLRQIAAAFWVAALVPVFIALVVSWILPPDGGLVLAGAWILYSFAGLWWAWWLFQQAEDTAWAGGAVTLPVWRFSTTRSRPATAAQRRRPLAALIGKELQLHHTTLFCAVGLLVLHFGVIALRKAGHYSNGETMQVMLDGFLMVWLAVPLIIGCSAVAEERRLGMMEEHLCLPVSSRVQFTVKFLVTLLLGAFLGAVLPFVVESIGGLFGAASSIMHDHDRVFAWLGVLVAALAIAGISFYASTLTSNILQSLATAVAMIIGIGCVFFSAINVPNPLDLSENLLCGWILANYFVWTLMIAWIATAICLAYDNFKHLHRGWRIWLRNILSLAVVLAFLAAIMTAL